MMRISSWLIKGWPPLAAVVLLLLVWQWSTRLFHVDNWLLPGPLQVWREGRVSSSVLWSHTLATLKLTLLGFAAGSAAGFAAAVVLHRVPWLKACFYPLLLISQNIPMIALAPLLMIWFGFGLLPKIIVIVLVCFFPIVVSAMDGLRQAEPTTLQYMRMIGASRGQLFWKLELPGAVPALFSGLKISAAYSVMGAVIAEWLGADKGIGVYMMLAKSGFHTDRVFLAIGVIIVLSSLFFGAIVLMEKLLLRWKE